MLFKYMSRVFWTQVLFFSAACFEDPFGATVLKAGIQIDSLIAPATIAQKEVLLDLQLTCQGGCKLAFCDIKSNVPRLTTRQIWKQAQRLYPQCAHPDKQRDSKDTSGWFALSACRILHFIDTKRQSAIPQRWECLDPACSSFRKLNKFETSKKKQYYWEPCGDKMRACFLWKPFTTLLIPSALQCVY